MLPDRAIRTQRGIWALGNKGVFCRPAAWFACTWQRLSGGAWLRSVAVACLPL